MMSGGHGVSIIIPVYNEKHLLRPAVEAIRGALAGVADHFELLIVESGSTDDSDLACDALAVLYKDVRVIHEGARNGFGSALRLGIREAAMDRVCIITVDLPFPLDILRAALPLLDSYECVLSYRVRDRRNLFRLIQSWAFNLLAKKLLGLRARHVNAAPKMFRRTLIQSLDLKSNGWLIDAEILYRLQERNASYTEVPVELVDRAVGSSSTGACAWWRVLQDLLRFRRENAR